MRFLSNFFVSFSLSLYLTRLFFFSVPDMIICIWIRLLNLTICLLIGSFGYLFASSFTCQGDNWWVSEYYIMLLAEENLSGGPEENVSPFALVIMLFYNFVFIVSPSIINNISLLLAMWTSCLIHSFRLDHILQPYTRPHL